MFFKFFLIALFFPSIFFRPDPVIDNTKTIKSSSNGIFKVRPIDSGGMSIKHTDKQVYELIASSGVTKKEKD